MSEQIIACGTFVLIMVMIVTEKVHRAVAAVFGMVILLLTQILSFEVAVDYVDFNTLGVLLGMMIFVGVVKYSGIFEYVAIKSAKLAKGDPWKIMMAFMIITAFFSAMLDNVTTVLLIAPMTLTITKILGVNPMPYLLTQAMASNIGGTATLIGDPPNIMIGSAANLSFMEFLINDGLPIIFIMAVIVIIMKFVYGRKLTVSEDNARKVMELDEKKSIKDPALLKKSIVMIILVAAGFILHGQIGVESSVVALTAAVIMLLIGRQNVEDVIFDVEWPTIIFFIGLFVTVGGMVETGVIEKLATLLISATTGHPVMTMLVLLWASGLVSAILDNIPFVATLIPLVTVMEQGGVDVYPLWWAISLGACLGGNGSLIGASANIVIASISGKNGYPITFAQFTKVGFPIMICTLIMATIYMLLKFA